MSFRDLRNFSECMRALGFERAISLESFRAPNWELLELCTRWLAERLDPDVTLQGNSSTTELRTAFIADAVQLFHSRGNVQCSGRRLYGADGWAVRELLKVAALLTTAAAICATPAASASASATDGDDGTGDLGDVSAKMSAARSVRTRATELTARGALLADLLQREPHNKMAREAALSRSLDMAAVEGALRRALAAVAAAVDDRRQQLEAVAGSEQALDAKLARRRQELARAEKRLQAVQRIRPAYQGELSALESELSELWEQYVVRYRCVSALQHQLAQLHEHHDELAAQQQAAIMQLIHKYEGEDVLAKLAKLSSTESQSESSSGEQCAAPARPTRPTTRLRIKTANKSSARAFGNMAAAGGGRDARGVSPDSDLSDMQLYGDGGAEDGAGSVGRWSVVRPRPGTRARTVRPDADDDDDDDDSFAQFVHEGGSSLASSSDSELRVVSPPAPAHAHAPAPVPRPLTPSDNEF